MIPLGFEWDPDKAASNETRHRVSFIEAVGVFSDPFAIEFVDDRLDYGEERYILIGLAEGKFLTVVYTERSDRIRIISARKAQPNERKQYHEENR